MNMKVVLEEAFKSVVSKSFICIVDLWGEKPVESWLDTMTDVLKRVFFFYS